MATIRHVVLGTALTLVFIDSVLAEPSTDSYCGAYRLYPYTDQAECYKKKQAPVAVCDVLFILQRHLGRTHASCMRSRILLGSRKDQWKMLKAEEVGLSAE
ncbi:MAG: hypothetical protein GY788_07535 [bacterium]|nr:hypothetical protein [bacterium]